MEIFLKWGSFIKNIKTYFAYIDYRESTTRKSSARKIVQMFSLNKHHTILRIFDQVKNDDNY